MPLSLISHHSDHAWHPRAKGLDGDFSAEIERRSAKCVTIGLINNMPDGALAATERQYLSLLDSASDGMLIRLSLYSLPGIPRNDLGERHITDSYSTIESLWSTHLDGLIVTGREPLAPNLMDEPYWKSLVGVLEWAQDNTYSTVWSCLAAHAALLHMDGIGRVKSNEKYCGVFECNRQSDHFLTARTPSRFKLPHSRWNGLSEKELAGCGYGVLTQAADAGVDTFIKQQNSLFIFFQGHPEYESNTLLREYRRDVGRYLRGEANAYPTMPRSYFDHRTITALTALQKQAIARPHEELVTELSAVLEKTRIANTWHSTAACIYRNWLTYICAQKQTRLKSGNVVVGGYVGESSMPLATSAGDVSNPAICATGSRPSTALLFRDR